MLDYSELVWPAIDGKLSEEEVAVLVCHWTNTGQIWMLPTSFLDYAATVLDLQKSH